MKISVVGLGKLGLCLAACFAERGYDVIGVDIEEKVVSSVNEGKALWFEPGLPELLQKHGGKKLIATNNYFEAIENTDITFILVPTPSLPDGSFSNRFIEASLVNLSDALSRSFKKHHIIVISSTIMPESTQNIFIPLIEKYSGRKLNDGFSICYAPEFVALGNVINGFLKPDLVIIGESSPWAGEQVENIYKVLCINNPPIFRMSIINAELAKVFLNVYITIKISFANSIANLCEFIPGADVDIITQAIGHDRRISPYYFQGGLAFGGTCFPRDVKAYIALSQKYGVQAELVNAVDYVNQYQNKHLVDIVLNEIKNQNNKAVGILGLSFTNNTPVVTESPAIKLISELLKYDIRVIAYDPLAIDNVRNIFGSAVEYVHSAEKCLAMADLVVITLRSKEFKNAVENYASNRFITIVDCWRIIDKNKLHSNVKYIALGRAKGL